MKIRDLIGIPISLILIIFPVFFVINLFYYIDPVNMCVIRIDNKSDLTRQAVRYAKNNLPEDYKLVCGNISKIVETVCFRSDWNLNPGDGTNEPGCYLRGTKIVYIKPKDSAEENAKTMAKLAGYSREYWNPTSNSFLIIYDKIRLLKELKQ